MTAALMIDGPLALGRTKLRVTQRGRRVLAAAFALPLAAVIFLAVLSGGSALASRDAASASAGFTTVTVQPGESLWTIAVAVAPDADPRDVVDDIARLNALDSSVVSAGQQLAIPVEYAP